MECQRLGEAALDQPDLKIGCIPPGLLRNGEPRDLGEPAHIYVAPGDVGPVVQAAAFMKRLPGPVLYSFGKLERAEDPRQHEIAKQLVRGSNVDIDSQRHHIIFESDFHGEDRKGGGFQEAEEVNHTPSYNPLDPFFDILGAREDYTDKTAHASEGGIYANSCILEPGQAVCVSYLSPDDHSPSSPQRMLERFASIGPMLKGRKKANRFLPDSASGARQTPYVGPPLIHFHSHGVDFPGIAPTHPSERNFLEQRLANVAAEAGPPRITVVSLVDALFYVHRREFPQPHRNVDPEIPFMHAALASWCIAVTRLRAWLRENDYNSVFLPFPINRLCGGKPVPVSVMVDIPREKEHDLKPELDRVMEAIADKRLSLDLMGQHETFVDSCNSVKTLSDDALEVITEAAGM